ncbi:MAG TPA: VIT and VWA domain-containing protein, partial [Pyrinomonadaceae bacterium]|nr:VIT and VWA domain-containing protein [Pyrinomonadaceae bacterium]
RVTVTQEFENPFKEPIEAVYTFPLSQTAAVDDMTMLVGDRTIKGRILRREEAQAVYEAARSAGQLASLLDQERPNIFTQSVANILPGDQIKITISYVEHLKYEDGSYEFVFPMVVGPRYIPGTPSGAQGKGFAPDTDVVPDGSRITPQPVPEGMRVGHDVSIDIQLDAGMPITQFKSKSHAIDSERLDNRRARIRLKNGAAIPNKDFVLRYDVAGSQIGDALITHRSERGGFFSLILQPPERVTVEDVTPKELVFVLDTSGSMSGFPIEKAKETMKLALDNLYPADTFNLITFAGDTRILFPQPVPVTPENLKKAQQFLSGTSGQGGTEMMKAIKAALVPSNFQDHLRIVCFMTDGFVGNDMAIIDEIQKHGNARVFAFGIGSSVNRFLLDKMAEYGRGEVEYVSLNDDGSAAARRFHERVRNPLLTDVAVEWNGLPVADVYPERIPDLFGAKPVVITGRFTSAARGAVRLKGKMSGNDFVREIAVEFPESAMRHEVLASLWARARVDLLMGEDYLGIQRGSMRTDLKETITQLGLEYRLLTQFTSFVAVQEMIITDGGKPRRIDVPVEVLEGVEREAVFGQRQIQNLALQRRAFSSSPASMSRGAGGGVGAGSGGGIGVGRARNVSGADMRPGKTPAPTANQSVAVAEEFAIDSAADKPPRDELAAKLHPSVLAVIHRLKEKKEPGPEEASFIREDKADLQIWLLDKSEETMAELRKIGFAVLLDAKGTKVIIGRLSLSKLEDLTKIKAVRYVAPQTSSD